MLLNITDDLDLDRIAKSGQCFRWERMQDGSYRVLYRGQCLYVRQLGEHTFDFSCDAPEFDATWKDYFDLDEDYAAIRMRIDPEDDPFLWHATEHEKGIRILRQDPWEMLITFIISQNKNIPAIRRSVNLLCEACGTKLTDVRGDEYYAFPDPESVASLSEDQLKACKLGYRCRYVHAAAKAIASGDLDLAALHCASESQTIAELTKVLGVGVKVASCVSLFGLHHTDAFPKDVWIKRILENEYPQGYPFEKYSPYNGIYQQYMFAYYRQNHS
ncbi:MAG: DNA-3-methyladenine glycosylase 2 family protein [Atopobiaceae bacterium]|nr:DNA-3-methyladenine glycosylase 2 family protein [Atopobiaceae bacterium]